MAFIGNTNTTQAFTPAIDYFSGNGSTTAFTLSRPVASVAQVQVVVNNVAQNPSSAYTVSGNTITFTSAPSSGTNNIYVYYTSPITQVVALPQNPQVFGNLQFSSSGARITGDFSNATVANRVSFQDSTTNNGTYIQTLPNGTSQGSGIIVFNNSTPTNAAYMALTADATTAQVNASITGTGTYLPMTFRTGGSERMRVDSSGNVGIGTSSPSYKLDVRSTLAVLDGSSNIGFYANGSTYTQIWQTLQSTNDFIIQTTASKYISFGINSAEKVRIDTSGNLLVNTTSQVAQGKFGVAFVGSTNQAASFNETSGAASWTTVLFQRLGTTIGSISNATSSTAYNTSSDYRLKNTIAPMTGALAKVQALKPVTYKWNIDDEAGEGFIAHELAEVCPHAVTGTKDAVDADGNPVYQGVDTSFLVATLTAAIQEQQALITALTARIEALENK